MAGTCATRLRGALALALLCAALIGAAGVGAAKTITVCAVGCAFGQIAPAIAAAQPGDTISIAAGTYAGGFTIDRDLKLAGAGAGSTVIGGGGPVITIGTIFASSEPTVTISGVTITGGATHSSPQSQGFFGVDGVWASGGGIEIPPDAAFDDGANVTVSNSVITGNQAAPTTPVDSGLPCPADITITCINGDLPFAIGAGGGIDSWGTLSVVDSTISDNRVGAAAGSNLTSDANGGAIMSWIGPLTIVDSTLDGNHAAAAAPNGRFADGGAILDEGSGALTISGSTVTNNSAVLDTNMPNDLPDGFLAIAGGVHAGGNVPSATVTNTTVSGNSAAMTNTLGDSTAFSGGLHTDNVMTLANDVIANNSITSTSPHGNAQGDSGAGELGGSITNTRLTNNSVTATAPSGSVNVAAGASIFGGTMVSSVVSGNSIHASGRSVTLDGGGLLSGGPLTLRNTTVSGNSSTGNGASGLAQGGGIFAVDLSPNGPPGGPLVLQNSNVTGNTLGGNAGVTLQGGGLYVSDPLTLTHSTVSGNTPDNCFGPSC